MDLDLNVMHTDADVAFLGDPYALLKDDGPFAGFNLVMRSEPLAERPLLKGKAFFSRGPFAPGRALFRTRCLWNRWPLSLLRSLQNPASVSCGWSYIQNTRPGGGTRWALAEARATWIRP